MAQTMHAAPTRRSSCSLNCHHTSWRMAHTMHIAPTTHVAQNEKGATTTQNRCAVFQLRRFPCCGCRHRGWRAGCIRHLRPATRRTTLQAPGWTDERLWSASRRPWWTGWTWCSAGLSVAGSGTAGNGVTSFGWPSGPGVKTAFLSLMSYVSRISEDITPHIIVMKTAYSLKSTSW